MKADWNDAPEYIRPTSRRSSAKAWIIPGVIGTCITWALLQMVGLAFLKGTAQNLAGRDTHSNPAPAAQITRQEQVAAKDWQRIVDEQAKRDQATEFNTTADQSETSSAPTKQTVFDDNNYIPRGAYNVVSFIEPARMIEEQKAAKKMKVTIIKQEPSMKDRACSPHKEGSIAHRDCKSSIGLSYRN